MSADGPSGNFTVYDRGNLKQMWQPRQYVFREDYLNPRILLPDPEEMPNIDLEVINFHKPPVGTFHASAFPVFSF